MQHFCLSHTQQLSSFLRSLAVKYNVNHVQLASLAKGLNNIFPVLHLPRDSRTLLKTVRGCNLQQIDNASDDSCTGDFIYLGLQNTLEKYLLHETLRTEILETNTFRLIFNVDGIPVFKSSSKQFWPILCKIYLKKYRVNPFPVAVYFSNSKPVSISQYLHDFVLELNNLICNGIRYNNRIIAVCVLFFTCDAPARAF